MNLTEKILAALAASSEGMTAEQIAQASGTDLAVVADELSRGARQGRLGRWRRDGELFALTRRGRIAATENN